MATEPLTKPGTANPLESLAEAVKDDPLVWRDPVTGQVPEWVQILTPVPTYSGRFFPQDHPGEFEFYHGQCFLKPDQCIHFQAASGAGLVKRNAVKFFTEELHYAARSLEPGEQPIVRPRTAQ